MPQCYWHAVRFTIIRLQCPTLQGCPERTLMTLLQVAKFPFRKVWETR